MLAEVPGNPLSSGPLWTATRGKDEKGPGLTLQRSRDAQRKMSSQRCCFLGVETWAELKWEDWELGGEFTKTLLLKNIHSKLQKLRFRPPVSKFFTTLFPQIITLSPGTSFSLPVTFRPLDRCEYQDTIEFHSKDGLFQVSLRATIPRHALDVPESVLLPPCAVLHQSQTAFMFRNASKLQTGFQWEVPSPFQLCPESGMLEPGQERRITVLFRPREALVYQVQASCAFGDEGENSCTVLLQGLSKYPFLQISAPGQEEGCKVLEFGNVPVGCTMERHFEILNPSSITTSFSLSRMQRPALSESVFQCGIQKGEVAPRTSIRVPVIFSPVTVDSTTVDYLSLTCPGALSKTLLKVTGTCIGPQVSLSSSMLDFGCVDEGEEALRTVDIINSSSVEAQYQFDLDTTGHSVFTLEPACGALPPNSHRSLRLLFRPHHPMGHHRRVVCLLLHREPLFLDLIGTCHSEQLKPAILHPRHLVLYRQHLARGLTCYPPDVLGAMLAEDKIQVDQEGALMLHEDPAAVPEKSPMEEYYQGCAGGKVEAELGGSGEGSSTNSSHVTVDPPELLFLNGSLSTSQSVTLSNHTKGKLSLVWTPAPNSPFSVTPSSCDLGPLKSTAFRVSYTPKQHNTFHGAQLECFAHYKVLRDHRQVEDRTLCPSWCVTVRVIGHSFQPCREHFIPRFSLQHPRVVFPALSLVSYRTVLLENMGDLPLVFRLDPEECPSVTVQPTSGLVQPGHHQILTLRTTPAEDCPAKLPLTLHFNASPKHTQELSVVSVVEKLCLSLEGEGSLFFKPTAVGSCSQSPYRVRNLTRLPLRFHWRIPGPDQRFISVAPDTGVLQPNETMVQTWSFTPFEEMVYNLKPNLTFWPIQTPGCRKSRLPLKVVGMASKGSIQAEHSVLDLGEVLVGDCRSFEVPLINNGSCSVSFCLSVQQSLLDPGLPENTQKKDPVALELDSVRGTIPARSRLLIRSTVRPARRTRYCWDLTYQTLSSTGSVLDAPQALCQVLGEGVFPTLEVTDVRCSGSVEGLSKLQIWSLFSLGQLNAHLQRDPAPPELTYRVPTRHSLRRCPSIFTSAMLDFNFSAAPLGSDPSSVLLMFENTGSIPVEWSFLFPEDQQIELEYWAETGEFSTTELHHMKVQDNRLFNITPRSGKLHPGQQKAVTFSYRHDFAGTDRLPVLFKLSHGREILLNFMGVTVERDRHYLHFTSTKHVFAPVAIGGFSPPKQVYELYNGGAVPLRYRVDTEPLEQLTADNFGHPVLQCLNPQGEVKPGRTALLEWVLSPLEAKTYSVDISIHVLEGDTMLLTFEGCGFDNSVLGESAPVQLHDAYMSVPSTQRMALPNQVLFLSEERLSLGDIPVCCRSTRVLFLTNVSHSDRVLYTWNLTDQSVQIYPEHGTLSPGESSLCILTLQASGSPSFYQLDIICEVTLEEALSQYHQDLQQWELERDRQRNEFTLTEKDLQPSQTSYPQGHTPSQTSYPQGHTQNQTSYPQGHTPSQTSYPQGHTPSQTSYPQGHTPSQTSYPQGHTPSQTSYPQGHTPSQTSYPQGHTQNQTSYPQGHTPSQTSYPQGHTPSQTSYPQGHTPSQTSYPQGHTPSQTSYPQGHTPSQTSYPQGHTPSQTSYPQGHTPSQTSYPQGHTQNQTQESNTKEVAPSPQKPGPVVRKYKTLPPIHSSSSSAVVGGMCTRPSRAERRAQREASQVWRRPEPPCPTLLHLGVTARSHSLLEFQTFFPSLLSTHHINRSARPNVTRCESRQSRPPSVDMPPLSHGPERDIITHTLTSIFRSLLDDPRFHHSLVNGVAEPVPYFTQLRQTAYSPTTPLPGAASPYPGNSMPYPGTREAHPPCPPTPQLLMGGSLYSAGVTEVTKQQPQTPKPTVKRERQFSVQETIRRLPEFCDVTEEVLLNTLQNLMVEAFLGELVLTARPRIIALPPVSARRNSCGSRRLSRGAADPDRSRETRGAPPLGLSFSPGPHLPPSALLANLAWT
ncbi:cilia- and flagella-associated protein 65 isoform X2 [Salmo trutta]|uniref:cilia- and flagella-associated protein 65 isoform X2 n=1 Tax=Salmo trutta TaxID=8032 RepID=UPI00113253E5|nr:cilia- and flagella-associated protein 65 isoform X2 [Salmo trutta]